MQLKHEIMLASNIFKIFYISQKNGKKFNKKNLILKHKRDKQHTLTQQLELNF